MKPMLLQAHPSPTTGKFSFGNIPNANGRSSAFISEALDKSRDNFFEDINTSSFAFKPFGESGSFPLGTTNKVSTI
jgi:WRKY transcription factor 2